MSGKHWIPTGVVQVCERDGVIDRTGIFRKGGDSNLRHCSKIFTRSIQVYDDFYDSRTLILNCPVRILLISNSEIFEVKLKCRTGLLLRDRL